MTRARRPPGMRGRSRNGPVRVLVGTVEVAGYALHLVEGLHSLGIAAERVLLADDRYGYGATERTPPRLGRIGELVHAMRRFDTFVFLANHSFLWGLDVPVLRLAGKRVVMVYLGIDSRPPYLDRAMLRMGRGRLTLRVIGKVVQLRLVERFASLIVSNPLSSQLHRRPFVSFGAIGLPYPHDVPHMGTRRADRPVVVHAPTDAGAKGTAPIEQVLHQLADEGVIDYRRLENLPNAVFVQEVATADLVVDQLYSDTPAGGVACQARLSGVPALVFGYGGDAWRQHHPYSQPPALHHPDQLETVLRETVRRLLSDGMEADEFGWTQSYTDRTSVADRLCMALEGNAPAHWWCDPRTIRYALGRGLSAEELADGLRRYRRRPFRGPLFLRSNPVLRTAIQELATA